ncbi:MAG: response regulator [Thermotogae bacterium]|nr:response regulator [Thermotogota bacterium]
MKEILDFIKHLVDCEKTEDFVEEVCAFLREKRPKVLMALFNGETGEIVMGEEPQGDERWYEQKGYERIVLGKMNLFFKTADPIYIELLREIVPRVYRIVAQFSAHEQFKNMYAELKNLENYRVSFLRSISHELKTPLNVIYGNIQLMELGIFGDVSHLKDPISSMKAASESAINLVNNLLELSKLESRKFNVHMEVLDFSDFRKLVDQYENMARQKGLNFSFEFKGPRTFSGDFKLLSSIISNLLSNAVKYTDRGEIRGILEVRNESIYVEVKDTGRGIPEELRDTIFEPFSVGRSGEGSGLGLSIVKKFVDMMGGKIEFESEPGKGTIFRVEIPRFVKPVHYTRKEKLDILIIEPDRETRKMLREILRGYSVVEAETGYEGYMKALEHTPDLIISDLGLPDISGKELIKKLQDEADLSHTSFVLYTGAKVYSEDIKVIEKGKNIQDLSAELKIILGEKVLLVFEESVKRHILLAKELINAVMEKEIVVKSYEGLTDELLSFYDTFVILVPNDPDIVKRFMNRFAHLHKRGLVVIIMFISEEEGLKWRV